MYSTRRKRNHLRRLGEKYGIAVSVEKAPPAAPPTTAAAADGAGAAKGKVDAPSVRAAAAAAKSKVVDDNVPLAALAAIAAAAKGRWALRPVLRQASGTRWVRSTCHDEPPLPTVILRCPFVCLPI